MQDMGQVVGEVKRALGLGGAAEAERVEREGESRRWGLRGERGAKVRGFRK